MYNDKKVSISIGGGLGDAIQTYLANPESHCRDGEGNYPTTNHQASLWFRRLRSFKTEFPDTEVCLIITSHNPVTRELFETNPYIDKIVDCGWTENGGYRLWSIDAVEYAEAESSVDAEMEYNPIHWFYDYQDFESDEFQYQDLWLWLGNDEIIKCAELSTSPYYIFHDEAPKPRDIMPIEQYEKLVDIINASGFECYRLGSEIYSIRLSVRLAICCKGFAGTHSAMWTAAVWAGWKYGIKTATFIPKIPHFDRIKGSAVAWGLEQPFNKTWSYYNYYEASKQDMGEVAEWLLQN